MSLLETRYKTNEKGASFDAPHVGSNGLGGFHLFLLFFFFEARHLPSVLARNVNDEGNRRNPEHSCSDDAEEESQSIWPDSGNRNERNRREQVQTGSRERFQELPLSARHCVGDGSPARSEESLGLPTKGPKQPAPLQEISDEQHATEQEGETPPQQRAEPHEEECSVKQFVLHDLHGDSPLSG